MKLVLLYLLAVCCYSLASTSTDEKTMQRRKLLEVLRRFNEVKETLQRSELMLYTPPQNNKECCSLSAFKCYRANLEVNFNISRSAKSLYRDLHRQITERAMTFCESGTEPTTCTDCVSHPKEKAGEFFKRMESLIQMAITRLTVE